MDKQIEITLYKESFTIHKYFRTMTLTQEHNWKRRNKRKQYDYPIDIDIAMTIYEMLQKKDLSPAELVLKIQFHQALVNNNISPLLLALS